MNIILEGKIYWLIATVKCLKLRRYELGIRNQLNSPFIISLEKNNLLLYYGCFLAFYIFPTLTFQRQAVKSKSMQRLAFYLTVVDKGSSSRDKIWVNLPK